MKPEYDLSWLNALRARVAAIGEPCRLLDADLFCTFHLTGLRPARPDDFDGKYGYSPGRIKTETGYLLADCYTRSLDDVLCLVEKVLPGWHASIISYFKVDGEKVLFDCTLARPRWEDFVPINQSWVDFIEGDRRPSRALAVIDAMLAAVISRQRAQDRMILLPAATSRPAFLEMIDTIRWEDVR